MRHTWPAKHVKMFLAPSTTPPSPAGSGEGYCRHDPEVEQSVYAASEIRRSSGTNMIEGKITTLEN